MYWTILIAEKETKKSINNSKRVVDAFFFKRDKKDKNFSVVVKLC